MFPPMTTPKIKLMTPAEFLAWEVRQEEKWELVDGLPRLRRIRLMAGGTVTHGLISANIIAALKPRLRGGRCVPLTSDVRVQSPAGAVRYPDVTVDCGSRAFGQLVAAEARVIFEVLPPSNSFKDQIRLLEDYQSIETAAEIVFLSQSDASLQLWTREGAGWRRTEAEGLDATLTLASLALTIPLAELYEGAVFDPPALT
jgi:Uma2 family endonuclease